MDVTEAVIASVCAQPSLPMSPNVTVKVFASDGEIRRLAVSA